MSRLKAGQLGWYRCPIGLVARGRQAPRSPQMTMVLTALLCSLFWPCTTRADPPIPWRTPDGAVTLILPEGWTSAPASGLQWYPGPSQKNVIPGSLHSLYVGGLLERRHISFVAYDFTGMEKLPLKNALDTVAAGLRQQGHQVLSVESGGDVRGFIYYRFMHTGAPASQFVICVRLPKAFYVLEMTALLQYEAELARQARQVYGSIHVRGT